MQCLIFEYLFNPWLQDMDPGYHYNWNTISNPIRSKYQRKNMPIPSAARFSIFKLSTLPPRCWNFRRRTYIFFCIFVVKFGHGSLCCSRALSGVIKVSCRFVIFIYKETLFIFARSGTALWYSELWTFISLRADS